MRQLAFLLVLAIGILFSADMLSALATLGAASGDVQPVPDASLPEAETECWQPYDQRSSTSARARQIWNGPIEWLDHLGPIGVGNPPEFGCFYVDQIRLGKKHAGRGWCAPQSTAKLVWDIRGGTPPFRLAIAGRTVRSDADYVDFPCEFFRQQQSPAERHAHSTVTITAVLHDARGRTATATASLGMVSGAPTERITWLRIWPGVHEAFVEAGPQWWPLNYSDSYDAMGPVDAIAVGRYRSLGTNEWSYATFFPAYGMQSGDGRWELLPHIRGLEPGRRYEIQAAWMWTPCHGSSHSRCPIWHLTSTSEHHTDWWEPWTDSDALQWSISLQFRTGTELPLQVEATDETVTIGWPDTVGRSFSSVESEDTIESRVGEVHVWLTSPDWPGAIWVDQDNAYRGSSRRLSDASPFSTAQIHGLPSATEFNVHVVRRMPYRFFKPPPQSSSTKTDAMTQHETTMTLAPSDIAFRIVEDSLFVSWTDHSPEISTHVFMTLSEHSPGVITIPSIDRKSSNLSPRGDSNVPRAGAVFAGLEPGRKYRLYLNHRPSFSSDGSRPPYVCMAWEVALARSTPDDFFDRYLFSSADRAIVTIAPTESFQLDFDERFGYTLESPCRLSHPLGE